MCLPIGAGALVCTSRVRTAHGPVSLRTVQGCSGRTCNLQEYYAPDAENNTVRTCLVEMDV